MRCRICGNERNNLLHLARDMRHGVGSEYQYLECADCGCIQIRDFPVDVAVLYPPGYYAHQPFETPPVRYLRNYLRTKWIDYGLTGQGLVGRVMTGVKPVPRLYTMLGRSAIRKTAAVLDVGCGDGSFLFGLSNAGFTNLTGIDPYIAADVHLRPGLSLFRRGLEEMVGEYDLITLNHSFEHMKDPSNVLKKLFELLKREGLLVVSIPVVGYAWRRYGAFWAGLEPPRHFYLHTRKSLQILCSPVGFSIVEVAYNSDAWQFVGSELNRRGIPWNALTDGSIKHSQLFTKKEIASFRKRAKELNRLQEGDQAFFFLKKSETGLRGEKNARSRSGD